MQALPTEFVQQGIQYTQLARTGMVALFRQQGQDWKKPRFEVVVIRIAKEHTWPSGAVSPERETYPSAGSWGTYGWTYHTEAPARTHLARLVAQRTAPRGEETRTNRAPAT